MAATIEKQERNQAPKVPPPAAKPRHARWVFRRLVMPDGKRHESASLWWTGAPAEYRAARKDYAQKHGLQFHDEDPFQ